MANQKSTEVIQDMIQLSADVIVFCQGTSLPKSVIDQVIRSVTSIGANFTEAQDASSKKDFLSKIYIAKKEAAETRYWLAIIEKLVGQSAVLLDLSDRTQKFVMMLQKIVNSCKESNSKSPIVHSMRKVNS